MISHSTNPVVAASELHDWLGWTGPTDFTLDEIAAALNIYVKEAVITGSEGRILIRKNSAVITISSEITHPGKRNFVLSHEIGHFLLHKQVSPLYCDTDQTLADWYRNGPQEQQANQFATALLMPSELFRNQVDRHRLNLTLIESIAHFFQVSLTAAFLRYVELGSYPCMVIYMEDGQVKWKRNSADFPYPYLPINAKVPVWTVAGDYFYKKQLEPCPEEIDAIEWFPDDYKLKRVPESKLWEQCYRISSNSLISCLWTK
jgi:Zn-dependent peptidase ImmA (M78 family)